MPPGRQYHGGHGGEEKYSLIAYSVWLSDGVIMVHTVMCSTCTNNGHWIAADYIGEHHLLSHFAEVMFQLKVKLLGLRGSSTPLMPTTVTRSHFGCPLSSYPLKPNPHKLLRLSAIYHAK